MKNVVIAVALIILLGLLTKRLFTDSVEAPAPSREAVESTDPSAMEQEQGAAGSLAVAARVPQINRLPDPASMAAAKAARIAELENKVISEPVSTTWAAENAQRIRSFLQADNLRASQLPAVDYAGIDCRTTICRVELRTQGSLAAGELTQGILQTISEQMPTAQIFESEGAGGTTLLIFSTASATSEGVAFRPKR